ncbi:MAG: DUF4160 domain-containing protein [Planctomycetota bacterium]
MLQPVNASACQCGGLRGSAQYVYICTFSRRALFNSLCISRSPCRKSAAFSGSSFVCIASWGPHHAPHFHAYYGDDEAVFGLEPVELLAGSLPRRQTRLVVAWAELHQQELVADWDRLQDGEKPLPISPLQ